MFCAEYERKVFHYLLGEDLWIRIGSDCLMGVEMR